MVEASKNTQTVILEVEVLPILIEVSEEVEVSVEEEIKLEAAEVAEQVEIFINPLKSITSHNTPTPTKFMCNAMHVRWETTYVQNVGLHQKFSV